MSTYYDLSHGFDENSYHPFGFPHFVNHQHFVSHGCRHAIATFSLHTATHIDAPWHMMKKGRRLDAMPVQSLIGPAVVLDISEYYGIESEPSQHISAEHIQKCLQAASLSLEPGDALILYTGRANQFLTDTSTYYRDYSTLGYDACEWLASKKVRLIGLDAPDMDLPSEYLNVPFAPKNHRYLLSRDIYIIENVGAQVVEVLNQKLELIPAPLKVQGEYASGAPVRLLARL